MLLTGHISGLLVVFKIGICVAGSFLLQTVGWTMQTSLSIGARRVDVRFLLHIVRRTLQTALNVGARGVDIGLLLNTVGRIITLSG